MEKPSCEYCGNEWAKKQGDDYYSAYVCYEADCQELFRMKYNAELAYITQANEN
jgi:hypothetical protein